MPFKYKKKSSEAPDGASTYSKIGRLVFEQADGEFTLSQVYLDTLPSTRPINASQIAEDVTLDEALTVVSAKFPDSICYVPVTQSAFAVTKSNAASIKLVLKDIKDVSDIQDTNDDGDAVYEEYVVRDIYHHVFNATDKTKAAETSEQKLYDIGLCNVEPVVYNVNNRARRLSLTERPSRRAWTTPGGLGRGRHVHGPRRVRGNDLWQREVCEERYGALYHRAGSGAGANA